MNPLKQFILLFCLLTAVLPANAQKGLNIETIFHDYGKREGSILIELAGDILKGHTRIKRYKSLIINSDSAIVRATVESIQNDLKDGRILMESRQNGAIESGYYCLTKADDSDEYEYILFTNKPEKMTVIYIRGNFAPQRLDDELKKLKNLFIKVNNKQIKL
ncbi:MAG: hypothetical protein LBP72_03845 [Dysgonamonadaceae bacterium]|jgi:hypothetical protein|nr:hypothetical protein [Dysgonamonadaceae bacterium]